jgi:hypothetical protein
MRPTPLPPPQGVPAISTPTSRDQPPPEVFSDQLLSHLATARPPPDKDRAPSGNRRPQPGPLPPFPPAGFVQVRRRLLLDIRACLGHRLCHGLHGRLLQVRNGAQTQQEAKQLLPNTLGGAFGQVIRPRAQGCDRLHPGPKAPSGNPSWQFGPGRCATDRAYQALQLIFGDQERHGRNLGHLMLPGLGLVPLQGVLATGAALGLDRDHQIDCLYRQHGPCLSLVARLSAGSTSTGLAARPFPSGLRRIARWRP